MAKVDYNNNMVFMKYFFDWSSLTSYYLAYLVEVSDNVYTVHAVPNVSTLYQHFFQIDGSGNIVSRDPQGRPMIYYISYPYLVDNLGLYYTG
ncbi:MAG: hypothetical protein QXE48_06490, partial [Nitrososphaerota archaeon]